jgi:hypothetical protein
LTLEFQGFSVVRSDTDRGSPGKGLLVLQSENHMARKIKITIVKNCHMSGTDHYCISGGSSTCYIIKQVASQRVAPTKDLTLCVSGARVACYPTPSKKPRKARSAAKKAGRKR